MDLIEGPELVKLTKRKKHSAQAKVLRFMGIEYKPRPDGSLAVSRAHVEKILGSGVVSSPRRRTAPDFSLVP